VTILQQLLAVFLVQQHGRSRTRSIPSLPVLEATICLADDAELAPKEVHDTDQVAPVVDDRNLARRQWQTVRDEDAVRQRLQRTLPLAVEVRRSGPGPLDARPPDAELEHLLDLLPPSTLLVQGRVADDEAIDERGRLGVQPAAYAWSAWNNNGSWSGGVTLVL
jgi:hypothetical protein